MMWEAMKLACVYLACVLLPCGAFAADAPGCLEFQAHPVAGNNLVDGTIVNTCAKTVTAFNFEVKIVFADGTSEVVPGLGREFLMSVGLLPPGHPEGVLAPGERRSQDLATFPPSHIRKHAVHAEATARWVIFDDSTAVGDEQRIERVFRQRRDMLDECTFWKQTVAKHRDSISTQGPLARLLELSAVRAPQRSPIMAQMAETMRHMIETFDHDIQSGSKTRAQAVQELDRFVSTLATNYQQQSERVR
jgi:hypothetical protein